VSNLAGFEDSTTMWSKRVKSKELSKESRFQPQTFLKEFSITLILGNSWSSSKLRKISISIPPFWTCMWGSWQTDFEILRKIDMQICSMNSLLNSLKIESRKKSKALMFWEKGKKWTMWETTYWQFESSLTITSISMKFQFKTTTSK